MSEITDKRKVIRQIREIKENLSYDMAEDYLRIKNACIDIENEYGEPFPVDFIEGQDFISEEDVEQRIREDEDMYLDRIRCFIGDTYSSSIYKIDGYGNLENVTSSDIEDLCDDVIKLLNDNISELKQAEL